MNLVIRICNYDHFRRKPIVAFGKSLGRKQDNELPRLHSVEQSCQELILQVSL